MSGLCTHCGLVWDADLDAAEQCPRCGYFAFETAVEPAVIREEELDRARRDPRHRRLADAAKSYWRRASLWGPSEDPQ